MRNCAQVVIFHPDNASLRASQWTSVLEDSRQEALQWNEGMGAQASTAKVTVGLDGYLSVFDFSTLLPVPTAFSNNVHRELNFTNKFLRFR